MVTPNFNYTSWSYDIPIFHNIASQPKLYENGNSVMNKNGNYVYEKINTDMTVVNFEWADNKSIYVKIHTPEWFGAMFTVWINLCH